MKKVLPLTALLCAGLCSPPVLAQKPSLYDDGCVSLMRQFLHEETRLFEGMTPEKIDAILSAGPDQVLCFDKNALVARPVRDVVRQSKAYLCISGDDLALSEALLRPIGSSRIRALGALPQSELELRATFSDLRESYDDDLIKRSLAQMARAKTAWPESSLLQAKAGRSIRDQIIEAVRDCDSDELIVIFAHNENGILRFPDGSLLDSQWIGRFNAKSPMPIVLSCETLLTAPGIQGVKTLRRLDFKDTGRAITRALAKVSGEGRPTPVGMIVRSIEAEFQALESVREFKIRAALGVTATGGISLFGVAVPESEKEANEEGMDE